VRASRTNHDQHGARTEQPLDAAHERYPVALAGIIHTIVFPVVDIRLRVLLWYILAVCLRHLVIVVLSSTGLLHVESVVRIPNVYPRRCWENKRRRHPAQRAPGFWD
jgi:hypothetical protein